MLTLMRYSVFATVSAACLLALVTGCHHRPTKYLDFTITPDAAAKTVAIVCNGSSSGKCELAFAVPDPIYVSIAVGANLTVKNIEPGTMYCSGTLKPNLEKCQHTPVPDHQATVKKQSNAPAPASN